jgi:hypothetical protein
MQNQHNQHNHVLLDDTVLQALQLLKSFRDPLKYREINIESILDRSRTCFIEKLISFLFYEGWVDVEWGKLFYYQIGW